MMLDCRSWKAIGEVFSLKEGNSVGTAGTVGTVNGPKSTLEVLIL